MCPLPPSHCGFNLNFTYIHANICSTSGDGCITEFVYFHFDVDIGHSLSNHCVKDCAPIQIVLVSAKLEELIVKRVHAVDIQLVFLVWQMTTRAAAAISRKHCLTKSVLWNIWQRDRVQEAISLQDVVITALIEMLNAILLSIWRDLFPVDVMNNLNNYHF